MAATKGARLKTGDGETDFAHKEGEKAAAHESLTRLLHKYVYNQHDQVACHWEPPTSSTTIP
jgi:hypothetical protein